jgi:hypothetical protein
MTIKLALATSTPTSMTVVATSTSISPARRRPSRPLSRHPQAAVHQTDAQTGQLAEQSRGVSSAACSSSFVDSSIRGQTQ